MPTARLLRQLGSIALCLAGLAAPVHAQNPDLQLTQAERDSVLATYDNIFPLLGRQAIEKGFDLPKPLGLNVVGVWVDQGIDIDALGLSTGTDPVVPVESIEFGDNRSTVLTTNLRADLWVLPFLNVYGMGGIARANTTVEIAVPIEFTSSVDQNGQYLGVGLTGAFGIKRFFTAVDVNWAWTDLEKLEDPVRSRVLSMRFGRVFKLSPKNRLNVWAGTMNVKFATETSGSILLAEAIPPETLEGIRGRLETVEDTEWYQALSPAQQIAVSKVTDALLAGDYSDVVVNYQLDKAPATKWNLLLGANVDVGKRWSFRTEVGLIGRYSVLLNAVYRLDL
jgi:hypothetical protein